MTPDVDLPANIHIIMSSKRVRDYMLKKILKRRFDVVRRTLVFVPPLANVHLMKNASACTYCGKLLQQSEASAVLKGLDCNVCAEVWCSKKCKQLEGTLHGLLKHNVYNPSSKRSKTIDAEAFLEIQEYCLEEQWNALYAITLIYANCVIDRTGVKQNNSMPWQEFLKTLDTKH